MLKLSFTVGAACNPHSETLMRNHIAVARRCFRLFFEKRIVPTYSTEESAWSDVRIASRTIA